MMFEMKKFSRVYCLGLVMLLGVLMFETVGCAGQKISEGKSPAYAANKPDLAEVFKHPQHIINASKLNLKVGDKTVRNVAIAGHMKRSGGKDKKKATWPDNAIGTSIWLPGNPDIFTVSWDCYSFELAMEYAALTDTSNAIMAQISGYKPIKIDMRYTVEPDDNMLFWGHPGISYEKAIETKDDGEIVNPKYPSDWKDGYPLAPELLKLRQVSRNAVLSGKVETKTLPSGRVMMPIRLLGKIVSAVDGKPIHMASAWLRRNPYIMARTNEKGAFEILMRNAILRSTNDEPDKLMINAPNYQAIEVDIKKYIDDKVTIKMKPLKLEFREDTIVKMVKIPARFFRMGYGNTGITEARCGSSGGNRERTQLSDWPIKTVYLPSYWMSIYELTMSRGNSRKGDVHANVAAKMEAAEVWAKTHGYTFDDTRNGGSWFWAVKMCNALSEMEGRTPCYYTRDLKVYRTGNVEEPICDWNVNGYRMPTEAEWDCAARSGMTTRYHWGSKLADQDPHRAWNWKAGDKRGYVGMKKPNFFGIHDFAAFSYEWVWDWDGHWVPGDTNHPKGPTLEETVVVYQWMFRALPYPPVFMISRRCRGNDGWGISVLQAKWGSGWPPHAPYSKPSNMGGVYRYPNKRSWQELGHNHGQPPTGGFGGIIRATISADLSTREHTSLKPAFDLKATLTPPVAIEKITTKIDMENIKGGTFRMGSGTSHAFGSSHPEGRPGSSLPTRLVTVSSFSIAKFETTSAQWQAVATWAAKNGYAFENTDVTSDNGATPVVGVTWYDALKWCNAASEKAGFEPCYFTDAAKKAVYKKGICEKPIVDWDANGYRLPTEAQWEFAARGGRTECYYWGLFGDMSLGWIKGKEMDRSLKVALHPVGRLPGNQFGLYDIVGNAGEWCWDILANYALQMDDVTDPKGFESKDALEAKVVVWENLSKEEQAKWFFTGYKKPKKTKKGETLQKGTESDPYMQGNHRVYRSGSHLETSDYWNTYGGVDTRFGCKPATQQEDVGFRVVIGGK